MFFLGVFVFALLFAILFCLIKFATGKLRKVVIIFNLIVVGLLCGTFIIYLVGNAYRKTDAEKYNINSGTAISGFTYVGKMAEGYHELLSYSLFASDSFLVPEENVEVSPLCNIFTEVVLYKELDSGGIDYYDNEIFIDPWRYYVDNSIVKVKPNITWMAIELTIYILFGFTIVNVILFVCVIIQVVKKDKE